MAVRERPAGFRGGICRWVTADEARQLVEEIVALETVDELERWAEANGSALVAYRCRLGDIAEPLEHRTLIAEAVVRLAHRRRHSAIVEHARERGQSLPAAVGTDESGRSLARCPACDGPINLGHEFGVYCRDHSAERDAEVERLLGEPRGAAA